MNGTLESDNTNKANILNVQFRPIFTQENDMLPNLPPSTVPSIPNFTISIEGVSKLLSDLNPHKATGPDGVPACILKVAAEEIAPALTKIFEKSLETGEVPSAWQRANIFPYTKKVTVLTHPITVLSPSQQSVARFSNTLSTPKLCSILISIPSFPINNMALELNIPVNPNFSLLSMTWPLPLNSKSQTEKVYFMSQILERPSIVDYYII